MSINVLVTGAAGHLAQFIWKALKASDLRLRIVGCNYKPEGAGLFRFDKGYVVPAADDPLYVPRVLELCRREKIRAVFAGNMSEMRVLAAHARVVEQETGAVVMSSPPQVLARLHDKWELTHHLAARGFDFPKSALPERTEHYRTFVKALVFPCVVKDRFGSGSRGFAVAHDRAQLDYLAATIPNPVVQEYLHPDDAEYTVGVFVCADGAACGSIVMHRQLDLGMTMSAEVMPDSPLGPYCEGALEGSGCIGPTNVQLRVTARGPVIFEVNPRCSSTTSARAHYGFNEPEMSIRHFVLGEPIGRPKIRAGRFFRSIEDVFVDVARLDELRTAGRIENADRPNTAGEGGTRP